MARVIKVWNDTTSAWEDVAVQQPDTSAFVSNSLVTAKGQIVGASGSGTPVAVPAASSDGQLLRSDSSTSSGVTFNNDLTGAMGGNATTSDAVGFTFVFRKARGTSIVQDGDTLGNLSWRGYNGSGYNAAAEIRGLVDGAPGASNDMPGRLTFSTAADGSATITERMRIDSEGRVRIYGGVLEAPIVQNAQSDSYTLVLADAGKMIEMGKATAQTLTIPLNSSVAFPVGTKIDVLQTGAGQVTIAGASGVTVNATPGLKVAAQWGAVSLVKRATDTWVAIGNLSA